LEAVERLTYTIVTLTVSAMHAERGKFAGPDPQGFTNASSAVGYVQRIRLRQLIRGHV
jgi:hypothetical protein